MKLSTPDQLRAAFQSAPPEIKEAYTNDSLVQVLMDIKSRYQLHVDVSGALRDMLGDLLLGLMTPAEFYGNLVLLGSSEQTARGIMDDLNKQIFLPLRDKMRTRSESGAAPLPDYSAPVEPAFVPPAPAATVIPTQPEPPIVIPTPEPAPTTTPISTETPFPEPQIRTMAHDMAAAKNHEGAQAPIPSAWSAPPAPPPIEATYPAAPKPHIEPVVQQPPVEKTYGVDPYREPIQ